MIPTRACAAMSVSKAYEEGSNCGIIEGSKIETIPEVRISETAIAVEESHHWRRSLRRQVSPANSVALLPKAEVNSFMAELNRPSRPRPPVRTYSPSQRRNDKFFVSQ